MRWTDAAAPARQQLRAEAFLARQRRSRSLVRHFAQRRRAPLFAPSPAARAAAVVANASRSPDRGAASAFTAAARPARRAIAGADAVAEALVPRRSERVGASRQTPPRRPRAAPLPAVATASTFSHAFLCPIPQLRATLPEPTTARLRHWLCPQPGASRSAAPACSCCARQLPSSRRAHACCRCRCAVRRARHPRAREICGAQRAESFQASSEHAPQRDSRCDVGGSETSRQASFARRPAQPRARSCALPLRGVQHVGRAWRLASGLRL